MDWSCNRARNSLAERGPVVLRKFIVIGAVPVCRVHRNLSSDKGDHKRADLTTAINNTMHRLTIFIFLVLHCQALQAKEIQKQPDGRRIITLVEGDDLKAALKDAKLGDTIELAAGSQFVGSFKLFAKPIEELPPGRSPWITIRTSAIDSLPPVGHRVTPADAAQMPKIITETSQSALGAEYGAHHYHFVGIEIASTSKRTHSLVQLGANGLKSTWANRVEQLPYRFVFERCYIHGNPAGDIRVGIDMNAREIAVLDSYISDIHEKGSDSQALLAWNGTGPFKIINNYLEGSGENVMFGGADPKIPQLVPSDIEFRRNYVRKPFSWKKGHAEYGGKSWTVKNLFELKNARRVWVEGNIFENNWADAQSGVAILFTPSNQRGNAPWCTVEDVLFTKNIIRNSASFLMISSQDSHRKRSRRTKNIVVRDNLVEGLSPREYGGNGFIFEFAGSNKKGPAEGVWIENNTTIFSDDSGRACIMAGDSGTMVDQWVFQNNIVATGKYGLKGTGTSQGTMTLDTFFNQWTFRGNLLIGKVRQKDYPPDNTFVPSVSDVDFFDVAKGDYRLSALSRYRTVGVGGQTPGVDMDAVLSATDGVVEGRPPRSDQKMPRSKE